MATVGGMFYDVQVVAFETRIRVHSHAEINTHVRADTWTEAWKSKSRRNFNVRLGKKRSSARGTQQSTGRIFLQITIVWKKKG